MYRPLTTPRPITGPLLHRPPRGARLKLHRAATAQSIRPYPAASRNKHSKPTLRLNSSPMQLHHQRSLRAPTLLPTGASFTCRRDTPPTRTRIRCSTSETLMQLRHPLHARLSSKSCTRLHLAGYNARSYHPHSRPTSPSAQAHKTECSVGGGGHTSSACGRDLLYKERILY